MLIDEGTDQSTRLEKLNTIARKQMKILVEQHVDKKMVN
jgi:hypothetical protein